MGEESRLDELLSLWEGQLAQGRDVPAAELCRDQPELLNELERRIGRLRQLGQLVQGINGSPSLTTQPPQPDVGSHVGQTMDPDAGTTLALPAHAAPPGYEILGELGRGGMGVVYKARQIALDRTVALKMILHADHAAAEARARFRTEARAVARLQHPHIVQVFEVGEHQGQPYFSLEFCAGGSLANQLDGTPWEPLRAAHLVETLARAMQAVHQAQVVHRDLKPANVLLSVEGTLKVTDFGVARKLDEEGKTRTGEIIGTPSYMAPEQAASNKNVGPPADIYASGAMLYQLLTGRPPFKAASVWETITQVLHLEPVALRQLQPGIPRDLETICLKCLQKDPGRRYASAGELADDLHRFLEKQPIQARPAGRIERGLKWVRRRPAAAALVAITGLAASALLGLGVWFTESLRGERGLADKAREQAVALARSEQEAHSQAKEVLADMHTTSGLVASERNDPAQAALWFATAVGLAPHDEHRTRANRLRFQIWNRNLAQPSRAVVQPMKESDPPWQGSSRNTIAQLLPHSNGVHLLARSAGSRRWTLWDMAAEKPVPLPQEKDEDVLAAAWNVAGNCLALGTSKGRCQVLSWPQGKVEQELPPGGPVREVSFSKNGHWPAVARGKEVRVWDVRRRSYLDDKLSLDADALRLVFDGQGKRLAVASADNAVRIWPLQVRRQEAGKETQARIIGPLVNWETAYHFHSHLPPVWVDDDRGLLTCASFSEVGWWDTATGKEVRRLKPELWNVDSITPSPDGLHVAITGWYGCKLYQARTGDPVGLHMSHGNRVPCAAFSSDSRWLLTGSGDQSVSLWSVPGGQLRGTSVQVSNEVFATAFLGNQPLAAQVDGLIRLWQPGQLTLAFRDHPIPKEKYADHTTLVDQEGRHLLTPGAGKGARVIDLESGLPVGKKLEKANPLLQGTFVPHHSEVVIQTHEMVEAWDWQTGKALWGPLKLPSRGYSVAASPDGLWVISMCADRGLLLDASTGKRIAEFIHEGQPELVNNFPNARFSPDGTCFATFDAWSSIMVWDTRTAKPRFPPLQHGNRTAYIAFSEDSRYLATGSSDHTARVFDLLSGQELAKLHHPHWVFDVAFNADSRLLLTIGRDGSARLWDWRTGKMVCPPMSQGLMENGCFLPGSPWLVTGTGGSVQAWDSVLGKAMTPPLPRSPGDQGFRLTLGGRQLAAFGAEGQVRSYDLSPLVEDKLQRLSPEQIRLFAEIQSMHTIHEGAVSFV